MRHPVHTTRISSTRLHTIDDPSKVALIVIDMQNLFLTPPSGWAGTDSDGNYAAGIIPAINQLIDAVRTSGGRVIFTRQTAGDQPAVAFPEWFKVVLGPDRAVAMDSLRPGTNGHELSPTLHVQPDNYVIDKYRSSAFLPDPAGLHDYLQENGVDTVIVTGTVTNHCCQATARDALMLDYRVLFVVDATAALDDEAHNATLTDLSNVGLFDLRTTKAVVDELIAGRPRTPSTVAS